MLPSRVTLRIAPPGTCRPPLLLLLLPLCRNDGHDRWVGFTDHHFLHYFVTVACFLHVIYIRHELQHPHPALAAAAAGGMAQAKQH